MVPGPGTALVVTLGMIAVLVSSTVLFHYEGLRLVTLGVRRIRRGARSHMLAIILGVFLIHMVEIGIYALAYWVGDEVVNIGDFTGAAALTVRDMLYFSTETYTGLGYGDISPTGDLRLLVGIETLNGLLLLGWTTSYTFVAMQQYWIVEDPADAEFLRLMRKRYHPERMDPRSAQMLALEVLRWLAADAKALERFLKDKGLNAEALRSGVGRREMAVSALDFLIFHPDLLQRYCQAAQVSYHAVHAARQHLDSF